MTGSTFLRNQGICLLILKLNIVVTMMLELMLLPCS